MDIAVTIDSSGLWEKTNHSHKPKEKMWVLPGVSDIGMNIKVFVIDVPVYLIRV